MEDLKNLKNGVTIHLTCESSAEYAENLAKAIFKVANKQVLKAEKNMAELTKKLNSAKIELEDISEKLSLKNSECETLYSTVKSIKEDIDQVRENLESEKESHAATQQELKSEQAKTKELSNQLEQKIKEHGNTKTTLAEVQSQLKRIEQDLEQEKKLHITTTGLLTQEKDETERLKVKLAEEDTKRKNQEKLIVEQLKSGFNEIVSLLKEDYDKLEDEQKNLKSYIKDIVEPNGGNYSWSKANSIDDMIHSFKFGDGYLSRIINLVWWGRHQNLDYQMSCITNIMNITSIVERIQYLLLAIGHSLTLPDGKIGENISFYNKYDVDRSHFMNIFDESYQTGTMCEVYLPAIDGKDGKCYIFYK